MVDKLTRLPVETRQALQQLACLGNVAAIATLSYVLEIPEERVHADLWPAVCQELIERLEGSCKFTYDRVRQEASYSMIPKHRLSSISGQEGCCRDRNARRQTGGGDFRHRQSAQPRRGTDYRARGTGPTRRSQPARRQTRQGSCCLYLSAHLSHRRWGAVEGRLLGAQARAGLLRWS